MLGREPALVLGLVGAVIALALAFGVDLSDEQVGAIMAAVVAVISIITRIQVTPIVDPRLPKARVTDEDTPL